MKHTELQTIRFRKLQRLLNIGPAQLVGHVELLSITTRIHAHDGALGAVLSDEDIAIGLEWDGDPGVIITALVTAGYLIKDRVHRLLVADWEADAPAFIKGSLKSRGAEFAKPSEPLSPPLSETLSHPLSPELSPPLSDELSEGYRYGMDGNGIEKQDISPLPPADAGGAAGAARPAGKSKALMPEIPSALAASPEFMTAWESWAQHRREKRKPLTPTSARAQLAQLEAMGIVRAIAALQHSTAGGYQGVFEPDQPRVNQGPGRNGQSRSFQERHPQEESW